MADHLAAPGQDDGADEPWRPARVVARLAQPECEETAVVVVGPVVRDGEGQLVSAAVEERPDQLGREPDELEPLACDRVGHASGPRMKIRPIQGR